MMVGLEDLDFGKMGGLIPVIVKSSVDGSILMQAFANEEALRLTMETGYAHFFSRTRNTIWKKGETSGNVLRVMRIRTDCDFDSVIYEVVPSGPTCHTGRWSCFHNGLPYDTRWDVLWELLLEAFSLAKVQPRRGIGVEGDYLYVINPITDSIPPPDPLLVSLMTDYLLEGLDFRDLDKVVVPEALGLPLGSVIAYKTGLPMAVVRKRDFGLRGTEVDYASGYEEGTYRIYGLEEDDKVLMVDDALSTGGTAAALLESLESLGIEVVGVLVGVNKPQYGGEGKIRGMGYEVRKVVDMEVRIEEGTGILLLGFNGRTAEVRVPVIEPRLPGDTG